MITAKRGKRTAKKGFREWLTEKPQLEIRLPDGIKKHGMDFPMFLAILLLCAFGVVMLFSASYYYAQSVQGDGFFYVKKQLMFLAIGIPVMIGVSHIKYTLYSKFAYLGYIFVILCVAATLVFGKSDNGASRWLSLGPIQFQPSELGKFVIVLCMAKYMTEYKDRMPKFFQGLVPMALLFAVLCVPIYAQPNMSMVIIICIVGAIMLFIGGASMKHFVLIGVIGVVGLAVLMLAKGYRTNRFDAWLDPWSDAQGKGFQTIQGLYAFGNGGWFGQGLSASRQKLLFLPYSESDFILPIIAEELGFFAVALLLAAYAFVIYRGIRVALASRERFASLVAGGISSILAVQVLVNVAVVTNTIPPTGQTLPFVSAGGTSLIIFLAGMGILLNISRYTEFRK